MSALLSVPFRCPCGQAGVLTSECANAVALHGPCPGCRGWVRVPVPGNAGQTLADVGEPAARLRWAYVPGQPRERRPRRVYVQPTPIPLRRAPRSLDQVAAAAGVPRSIVDLYLRRKGAA